MCYGVAWVALGVDSGAVVYGFCDSYWGCCGDVVAAGFVDYSLVAADSSDSDD